jgi:Putative MetA-pathway of phenol degradation
MRPALAAFLFLLWCAPALAGPPYVTDDAEPTAKGQWEVNLYTQGTVADGGSFEQGGVNASYGWSDDLELSATIASAFAQAPGTRDVAGFGDLQLGAKYRFIHQADWGVDVALVPGLSLPTHSDLALGREGVVPSLGLQFEKDWGDWSVFGGGGCLFPHDNLSQDFCLMGGAVTWQIMPDLQLGAEIYHATPGARFGLHTTGLGFGATYDVSERYHLLFSAGPGIQNVTVTNGLSWYTALQITI